MISDQWKWGVVTVVGSRAVARWAAAVVALVLVWAAPVPTGNPLRPAAAGAAAAAPAAAPSAAPATVRDVNARRSKRRFPKVSFNRVRKGVVLKGRTKARAPRLVVQRWAWGKRRWVKVKRIRARKYQYRTRVKHREMKVHYRIRRVRNKRWTSRKVRVRPARDVCGIRPRKGNGTLWKCSFQDRFSGTELDESKWTIQTKGFRTGVPGKLACYDRENVAVDGGHLRLTLKQALLQFKCQGLNDTLTLFSAGSVSTFDKFSQQYGRFEARTRNTDFTGKGLHEAFWLWPDTRYHDTSTWPFSGEIDIAETYSVHRNLAIPFLHYSNDVNGNVLTGKHTNTAWHCQASRGEWNTYRLEWSAKRIRIWVNDQLCLTNTSGDEAFRKKYIVAFTQGVGAQGNEVNLLNPPPRNTVTEVDWVRVWR